MSLEELIKNHDLTEYVRVEHELLTDMDKARMGIGFSGEGYGSFKPMLAYIMQFETKDMKEILMNGKWYVLDNKGDEENEN